MLSLFYKHHHYFYLPVKILEEIQKDKKQKLSKQLLLDFFKKEFILESGFRLSVQNITNDLFLVTVAFKTQETAIAFKLKIATYKELMPPWVIFPNLFQGVPRWNQGIEEDYGVNHWLPFWQSLNQQEKQEYMDKYDCPLDWKDWLHEFEN